MRIRMHGLVILIVVLGVGLHLGHAIYSFADSQGHGVADPCKMCTNIPFEVARVGRPSDVDMPEVRVIAEHSGVVTAVRHWFDGRQAQSRVIESAGGAHWKSIQILHRGNEAQCLIHASGSGNSRFLLRQGCKTGLIERSHDSGRSWKALRFFVNAKPASEWMKTYDSTPGHESIPRIAAVSAKDSLTLYASFKLWVPKPEKPSQFLMWKEIPGMYVSHDGGDNWSLFSNELVSGSPLGISGEDPNFFVGVSNHGLVESHDGGHSWSPLAEQAFFNQSISGKLTKEEELRARSVRQPNERIGTRIRIDQIELSPWDATTIYVRTNIGLVISRDGGRSWCVAGQGNHAFDEINGLVVSRTRPNELFISTTETAKSPSRILRSVDGGCTFKILYTMNLTNVRRARNVKPTAQSIK